ncbi:MAG: ribosome-associated translation inhibitor RaiA [Acidobacteria bacterium]|nr:ribosome-associated translation inhibitor RaiA [Acidobacteriota bacterium]
MTIRFTCRQTRLTPALRQFAEEKLSRLQRYLDADSEVHMVLSVEKHRHQAEMMINSARRLFTGTAITDDLYAAIGLVLDKLEKQLRRDKRRRNNRRRRETRQIRTTAEATASRGNGHGGKRSLPRILREKRPLRSMSAETAADDVEESQQDFLVFRNSESEQLSVIYRRPDGRLGLIEE